MLPGKRAVRVGDLILKEIAFLLLEKVKDQRVRGVTLTGIDLTDNLKSARVYFSIMGGPDEIERAGSGLESACRYIKREIGRRMQLRYVPDLKFIHDSSLANGSHMEKLFEKMREAEKE